MPPTLRKTRTLVVTEVRVTPEEVDQLANLYKDARYNALLNVMERACINIDTSLVNVSVGQPEEILGAHAMSKAAWLFFTYVQKQVLNAYSVQSLEAEPAKAPSLSDTVQSLEGLNFERPDQAEGEI